MEVRLFSAALIYQGFRFAKFIDSRNRMNKTLNRLSCGKYGKKKWILALIVWIVLVFLLNYFYSEYLSSHHKMAFFVSFFKTSGGLFITYKLFLDDYMKEIFSKN